MSRQEFNSFKEFWPFYVEEHSRPATRALHFIGTALALALFILLASNQQWRFLPLALMSGYAAAWAAHFFIEKNKPATFQAPFWSLISDYRMCGLWLSGRLGNELMKYQIRG